MVNAKVFNVKKYRPRVLLLGNGINRCMGGDEWGRMIDGLSGSDKIKCEGMPYGLYASFNMEEDDTKRHAKYYELFAEKYIYYDENELLVKLMKLPFDAVLTTNYTYEAECAAMGENLTRKVKRVKKYSFYTAKDSKYLIHTFNRVSGTGTAQDIWHIHGEARRRSSIILTHDEYIRLIEHMVSYCRNQKNRYAENDEVEFKSWIDYFILGNLYIVGQGFDYSENDLWWLMIRRVRENAECGKAVYFTPKVDNKTTGVSKALERCNVVVNDIDYSVDISQDAKESVNEQYKEFYRKVTEHLSDIIHM